jgi:hypothetical protein
LGTSQERDHPGPVPPRERPSHVLTILLIVVIILLLTGGIGYGRRGRR